MTFFYYVISIWKLYKRYITDLDEEAKSLHNPILYARLRQDTNRIYFR
jgi:hypothetical protein